MLLCKVSVWLSSSSLPSYHDLYKECAALIASVTCPAFSGDLGDEKINCLEMEGFMDDDDLVDEDFEVDPQLEHMKFPTADVAVSEGFVDDVLKLSNTIEPRHANLSPPSSPSPSSKLKSPFHRLKIGSGASLLAPILLFSVRLHNIRPTLAAARDRLAPTHCDGAATLGLALIPGETRIAVFIFLI